MVKKVKKERKEKHLIPSQVVNMVFEDDCSVLCAWRVYFKLTQSDLAKKLNIPIKKYIKIEKGEYHLSKKLKNKIANEFKIHKKLIFKMR